MIEGIKLDFQATELREHLTERIAHHLDRQAFYEARTVMLRGAEDAVQPSYSNSPRGNPVEQMEQSAKSHEAKAKLLKIYKDHLLPDETYRLEEDDLHRLEFIPARSW